MNKTALKIKRGGIYASRYAIGKIISETDFKIYRANDCDSGWYIFDSIEQARECKDRLISEGLRSKDWDAEIFLLCDAEYAELVDEGEKT